MSFLKKLGDFFSADRADNSNRVMWIYVRCNLCKEVISARLDLLNDLSRNDDESGFISRKVIMGRNRCFQKIETTLYFDNRRQLIEREISGGQFISEEEYQTETPA